MCILAKVLTLNLLIMEELWNNFVDISLNIDLALHSPFVDAGLETGQNIIDWVSSLF